MKIRRIHQIIIGHIADASPVGLGAVLVQEQSHCPVVVSYASHSISDVERRYSQTEKEALGLVWACDKFHPPIYGQCFELLTDHKQLEAIYAPKSKPHARIERWVLHLQPYEFKVIHLPGKNNIADPLSRLLKVVMAQQSEFSKIAEEHVRFVAINYAAISGELCVIGQLVLRGSRILQASTASASIGTRGTLGNSRHRASVEEQGVVARHRQSRGNILQIMPGVPASGTTRRTRNNKINHPASGTVDERRRLHTRSATIWALNTSNNCCGGLL